MVITRCGNFYGGGDLNWNRIVPGTIRSMFLGERPIIRSDGRFVRDYFYVEDAVAAYLLLAEHLEAGAVRPGEAFNLSNERPLHREQDSRSSCRGYNQRIVTAGGAQPIALESGK